MVLSRTPEAFFQDCVVNDQSAFTNYIYSMIAASILEYMLINHHSHMLSRNSKETVWTQNRGVYAHILVSASASLHPPSVSLPTKFQDFALGFSGLSKTELIFQDFSGRENFINTIPGLSRMYGNPVFVCKPNEIPPLCIWIQPDLWAFGFAKVSALQYSHPATPPWLLKRPQINFSLTNRTSQLRFTETNSLKPVSIMKDFYRTVLCICSTSHGPVSVCYKLVFY